MIDEIAIGTNKYGDPTDSIKLYGYGEAQNLTLGQLVNAVCCRAGFALETQSISLVNVMTVRTRRLSAAAKVMQTLVDGAEKGYDTELELEGYGTMTARKFLTEVMGYKIEKRNADGKVIVEGVQVATKHRKARKQGEESAIITMPTPVYASKVMLVCPKCGKPTRVGHAFVGDKKMRACKKCGAQF